MEEKIKDAVFQNGAIVFQNGAIQIHSGANVQMGGTQTITQNFYGGEHKEEDTAPTEADLSQALMTLKGERDLHGVALLSDKGSWYAVVRVCIDYFHFPPQLSAACEKLSQMGFSADVDYENIRRVPVLYSALNKPFREWQPKECSANIAACRKQMYIAQRLLEILGMKK